MMSSSSPAGNRPTGILNPAFEQETETMENNSVLAQKNLSSSFEETSSKDSSREPLFSFNVLKTWSGKLIIQITLTITFFFVELIVGYMNNSVALVADAFHMLSDVISLIVGLVAVRFQKKSTANPKFTFGYLRAEVVGALCNSVFLLALCFTIIIDAINALIEPERMSEPKQVLIVGGIGLFINLVGLFLFSDSSDGHGHSHGGSGQDSHAHSHSLPNPFKKFKKSKNHQHKQSKKSQVQPELIEPPNLPHVHLEDEVSSKGSHKNLPASIYENESPRSDNTDKNKPTNVTNNPTNQLLQIKERTTPIKQHHDQHNHEHNEYHDHHADYETDDEEEMTKKERNMNIQGVYLHVLGDALGSVIVMISAGIVLYAQQKIEPKNIDLNQLISSNNQTTSMTVAQLSEFVEQHHETNWSDYADPVLSIIITMIILKSTWILFIDSAKIVLQISPDSINPAELKGLIIDKILQHFDKEISIHDFHVWQLSSQRKIASLHVKIPYSLTDNWPKAMSIIKNIFHKKGVHNVTLQVETYHDNDRESINDDCEVKCCLDEKTACCNNDSDKQALLAVTRSKV